VRIVGRIDAVCGGQKREQAELFEGQFFGPQGEDILAAVMPYLSSEDQAFWTRLQQENPPVNYLSEVFCEFKTVLRRVVVEDVARARRFRSKHGASACCDPAHGKQEILQQGVTCKVSQDAQDDGIFLV